MDILCLLRTVSVGLMVWLVFLGGHLLLGGVVCTLEGEGFPQHFLAFCTVCL